MNNNNTNLFKEKSPQTEKTQDDIQLIKGNLIARIKKNNEWATQRMLAERYFQVEDLLWALSIETLRNIEKVPPETVAARVKARKKAIKEKIETNLVNTFKTMAELIADELLIQ